MNIDDLKKISSPIPGHWGYWITPDGVVYSVRSGTVIKLEQRMSASGYVCVTVTADDGCRTSLGIHRLLAMAYLPRQPHQTEVNHKDGNKLNNSLSNLEWCSHSENETHKVHNFMTRRTRPVVLMELVTGKTIIIPSTREADRFLGVSVNSVSRMLQTYSSVVCNGYVVEFYKD